MDRRTDSPGRSRRAGWSLPVWVGLLAGSVMVAVAWGQVAIPLETTARLLWRALFELPIDAHERAQATIVYLIRLPRVLAAAVVGASLAVAGAAMQGLFRNPLADAGLIGVSSGGALAGALVLRCGLATADRVLSAMEARPIGPAFWREVEACLRATRTKVYVPGEGSVGGAGSRRRARVTGSSSATISCPSSARCGSRASPAPMFGAGSTG